MNGVVIVAHPDDEIIWCGGVMLARANWQWTVMTLCRAEDPDRAPKFHTLCEQKGFRGIMSDLDDGDPLKPIDLRRDLQQRILDLLPSWRWDLCLTHGQNGEYGHQRHMDVHRAVLKMAQGGRLACDSLWTFAYSCEVPSGRNSPADWASHSIPLTSEQLREKKKIIHEQYGFAASSFEYTACISPESFCRVELGRTTKGA